MAELCDDQDLEDLKQKLLWRPSATGDRFLSVFMDQNNKCNLQCRTCGFSDSRVANLQKYDMPRWLFDKIACEVFPRTRYVCLSLLTEPLMTRDFPERLDAISEFGVPFSEFITNGTLLTSRSVEKILDSRLSRVIVSIDGGTKAVFEFLRPGARFEQVVANWNLLRSARAERGASLPVLRINHVLSEPNIDHFDGFLALAESLEPDEIAVRTVSRMSNAIIQETADPVFWQKVRSARVRLAAFCSRTGIRDSAFLRDRPGRIDLELESGENMTCRYPWDFLSVHPNGDAYPCIAWSREPIGNFVQDTFETIWNSPALQELRQEFEAVKPGVDCLHCTIRRADNDRDDDFFYRKLAKGPPPAEPSAGRRA